MIKIEFEQKSKKEILIFGISINGDKKEIGRIFTPAGSGETSVNAIQVCGFDHAYDLWGCGVYGDKLTNKMKKDIQIIWFDNYDKMNREEKEKIKVGEDKQPLTKEQQQKFEMKRSFYPKGIYKKRFTSFDEKDGVCTKCYNYPCTCEVKIAYENPYTVKREQDVNPNTIEDYDRVVKNAILNGLKE